MNCPDTDWGCPMAGGSHGKLTEKEVEALLTRLRKEMSRPECWSCECLQGFLAQLELDAAEEARPLLARSQNVSPGDTSCLGCEPCPPANIFAEYLMRRRKQ